MDEGASDIQLDTMIRQAFPVMRKVRTANVVIGGLFLATAALVAIFSPGGTPAVSVPFGILAATWLVCALRLRRRPASLAVPCAWMYGGPVSLLCVMTARFGTLTRVVQDTSMMAAMIQRAAAILEEHPHLQAAKEWRDERPDVMFEEVAERFVTTWNSGRIQDLVQFLPERARERLDDIWIQPLRDLDWIKLLPRMEQPAISLRSPWEAQADFPFAGRRAVLRTRWLHRDGAWGNTGRDWPKAIGKP